MPFLWYKLPAAGALRLKISRSASMIPYIFILFLISRQHVQVFY